MYKGCSNTSQVCFFVISQVLQGHFKLVSSLLIGCIMITHRRFPCVFNFSELFPSFFSSFRVFQVGYKNVKHLKSTLRFLQYTTDIAASKADGGFICSLHCMAPPIQPPHFSKSEAEWPGEKTFQLVGRKSQPSDSVGWC